MFSFYIYNTTSNMIYSQPVNGIIRFRIQHFKQSTYIPRYKSLFSPIPTPENMLNNFTFLKLIELLRKIPTRICFQVFVSTL